MELKTARYELYPYNQTTHAVVIYDAPLANKLNKLLQLPYDCKIQQHEEPVFRFDNSQLKIVLRALKVSQSLVKQFLGSKELSVRISDEPVQVSK